MVNAVEYELRKDEDGDILPCDNCDYGGPTVATTREDWVVKKGYEKDILLCEICYNTHLSKPTLYPHAHYDESGILGGIAWIGNKILEEIRKGRNDSIA